MSYSFRASGLIVVTSRLETATSSIVALLALDTGAERTLITPKLAEQIEATVVPAGNIITASRSEPVHRATLDRVDALGLTLRGFAVTIHSLPRGLEIEGLLGLDFFRETRLTLDFRRRILTLA